MSQDLVQAAKDFALQRHGDQKYGEKPYSIHLQAVYDTLVALDIPSEVHLAAAWLHDVLEDTHTTRKELEDKFGAEVTDLVWAVTGNNAMHRQESTKLTIQKIKMRPRAGLLKLADRYCNVKASLEGKQIKYLAMYVKEHKQYMEVFPNCSLRVLYEEKIKESQELLK